MGPLGGSAVTPVLPSAGRGCPLCSPRVGQCGGEGGIRVLGSDAAPYRSVLAPVRPVGGAYRPPPPFCGGSAPIRRGT
eukprot:4910433-Alexandrium_andersonii.AAC.1